MTDPMREKAEEIEAAMRRPAIFKYGVIPEKFACLLKDARIFNRKLIETAFKEIHDAAKNEGFKEGALASKDLTLVYQKGLADGKE